MCVSTQVYGPTLGLSPSVLKGPPAPPCIAGLAGAPVIPCVATPLPPGSLVPRSPQCMSCRLSSISESAPWANPVGSSPTLPPLLSSPSPSLPSRDIQGLWFENSHTAHHTHPTAPCARVGQAAGEQADRSWQPPGSPRAQPFTFLTLFPHMLKHRLKNPKPQQMITKWFPAMGVPTPPIRNRVKTWPGRKLKLRVPSAPRAAHPGCSS